MIHVLDALAVCPGHLTDVRRRVQDVYQPLVAVHMDLVHTWMAPAVELLDQPTELLFLWEVADVPAFWKMRLMEGKAARDELIIGFWHELEPLLAGRTRRLMCDPDDASVLR